MLRFFNWQEIQFRKNVVTMKKTFPLIPLLLLSVLSIFQYFDLTAMATKKKDKMTELAMSTNGWGGSPDLLKNGTNPNESKSKEYFYLKVNAKASAKSIEKNSELGMKTSCMDAAGLVGTYDILSSFMDALIKEKSPNNETGIVTLELENNKSYTCKYFESEDKKYKTKECSGVLQNRGIAHCWSSPGDSWETCGCLVYLYFPGGKESVLKKLELKE